MARRGAAHAQFDVHDTADGESETRHGRLDHESAGAARMGKVVSLIWAGSLEQGHRGLGRATAAGWLGEGAATRAAPWLGDDHRGLGAAGCGWEPGRSAGCRAGRVPRCRCDGCVGHGRREGIRTGGEASPAKGRARLPLR
jgi:hypothetical protein